MTGSDDKRGRADVKRRELTVADFKLLETLPKPPKSAGIQSTNVWIVEWLASNERPTGLLLHEWMKARRPGWSAYTRCGSKREVICAVERATSRTRESGMIPVLHLEAHGGDAGLEGPSDPGRRELLTWDELTGPLQSLNVATRCNLVVVVAACTGFAGIGALTRGPRAPAVALVGPDAEVMPQDLLAGTKEFYRRWRDGAPRLYDIVESASREAGAVTFELEPFIDLAYEAVTEQLVVSIKTCPKGLLKHLRDHAQRTWNELFMIDMYPENGKRFGLDMKRIVDQIAERAHKR